MSITKITQDKVSELFERKGAFFAFSNEQFKEAQKPGVKYVSLPGGMICPAVHAKSIFTDLDKIYAEGIQEDLKVNGKTKVIIRELYNHEAFYTGDLDTVLDALVGYGVTIEEVQSAYQSEYSKADL